MLNIDRLLIDTPVVSGVGGYSRRQYDFTNVVQSLDVLKSIPRRLANSTNTVSRLTDDIELNISSFVYPVCHGCGFAKFR